jgi:hypothetical protein
MGADLIGKVIAIRRETLSPEYRAESHQMYLATGGFGCSPTASGRAVYCTNLYTGEKERFSREDVLCVIAEDTLPAWAKEKLAALRATQEKPSVLAQIRAARGAPKPERKSKPGQKAKGPER